MNNAPIAIVGLAGRFPGADSPEQLWENILACHDASSDPPAGRWLRDADEWHHGEVGRLDGVASKRAYFLSSIPQIESLAGLDPVFHLALDVGLKTWANGKTTAVDRSRVGVILGAIALPTDATSQLTLTVLGRTLLERANRPCPFDVTRPDPRNRHVTGLPAILIAQTLGLGGLACTLDAACASSLYAVALAVGELRAGRADAMIAGGLSRPDSLYTQTGFTALRALSPSGRCSPFDSRADGLVVGEGAGMVLLKRLDTALEHGDSILGVITGIGLSNDIEGGLLAPANEGQLRAMRAAYAQANLDPNEIDLIECHATGTPVGDAVEFRSLLALRGESSSRRCVIGSVKSTVGHLLTGAGGPALAKVLFALKTHTLPPTANFQQSAKGIDLERSPLRVLTRAERWVSQPGQPRRAAISAFGFGGINAHVILEEPGPWHREQRSPFFPSVNHPAPSSHADSTTIAIQGGSANSVEPPRWWGVEQSQWFRAEGLSAATGQILREVSLSLERFRIPPREIEEMLPQQALVLDAVGKLLDKHDLSEAERLRTGVFLGVALDLNTTNFHLRWWCLHHAPDLADLASPPLSANRTMGALASIAASRIARAFRLGGPSFTISSCADSLATAMHLARAAIERGEIDSAIVGEVELGGDIRLVIARQEEQDSTPPRDFATVTLLRRDSLIEGLPKPPIEPMLIYRGNTASEILRHLDQGSEGSGRLCVVLLPENAERVSHWIAKAKEHLRQRPELPSWHERAGRTLGAERFFYTPSPIGEAAPIAIVYPGSGNDFPGMGRDLAVTWPAILERQARSNPRLREQYLPELFWHGSTTHLPAATVQQRIFAQVALGTLATDWLRHHLKIAPSAAIGYSLGESSMLFGFGVWQDREEMLSRMHKSSLFVDDLTGDCRAARRAWDLSAAEPIDWQTGIVERSPQEVRSAMQGLRRVYLQIINTPTECVIGGRREEVAELIRRLNAPLVSIPETTTMHCAVVEPVAQAYRELHRLPITPVPEVRFYSAGLGRAYEPTVESAADAILQQAMTTLNYPQVIERAYAEGVRVFVEAGPGASCTRMIGAILGTRPHVATAICTQAGINQVLRAVARLVVEGVKVDIEAIVGKRERGPKVTIPVGGDPWPAAQPVRVSPPPRVAPVRQESITPRWSDVENTQQQLQHAQASLLARAEAHDAWMKYHANLQEMFTQTLAFQGQLVEQLLTATPTLTQSPEVDIVPMTQPVAVPVLDRDLCMEFAVGKIGNVLGPTFAEADRFPTRVRLPDEPLMLVDRIMAIEGEPLSMSHGRIVTEHDIHAGAWYLDNDRIPTCIAVESGQADLFLSGYLGIDLQTRGLAVYRLLDAVVTFHRPLPTPGEVIHYDIHIDHFFRQGETWLFRFRFVGTVNGEPLLTMTEGIAGFFSEAELAAGKGVVHTELQKRRIQGIEPDDRDFLPPLESTTLSEAQVDALRVGDLATAFGPLFADLPLANPMRLPGGKMRLVHRITEITPRGGRFGLGRIVGEADIHPDDWFLTCHFVDDQVMPGTLMFECCLHTLRILLMRMGWVGEHEEVVCEPVPGIASRLKCRGQVIASTKMVTYEVIIKERGYRPEPYVICDAFMVADGKFVVDITDMSLRMSGLTKEIIADLWQGRSRPSFPARRKEIFSREQILAFAIGNPSECFGERYRVFDQERFIARLPGPPFAFLDRIVEVEAEAYKMVSGGRIVGEYDVPRDAWYFAHNRSPIMPFSVLLETALQPCGWMSAYLGAALTSEHKLQYRNLGGQAIVHRMPTPETGTLTTEVRCTRVAASGGMIIHDFSFSMSDQQGLVYVGDTTFGFFSPQALDQQVGVRDAVLWTPPEGKPHEVNFPTEPPYPDAMLRMLDTVEINLPQGGPEGKGWLQGAKTIRQDEWFFKAHFYQDPVWPGSLGLEALVQLMQVALLQRRPEWASLRFVANLGAHRWLYRGQVIPRNKRVVVQAIITHFDEPLREITADGWLIVDGLIIYRMSDFRLRCVE